LPQEVERGNPIIAFLKKRKLLHPAKTTELKSNQ